jgi:endonuclease III
MMDGSGLTKAVKDLKTLYQGLDLEPQVWNREGHKRDPYRVLVLMGLSLGTRDKQLISPCEKLFALCPDGNALVNLYNNEGLSRIGQIIKPLGLTQKNCDLIESTVALIEKYRFVPGNRDLLQEFPRIGSATAEKVVGYGYGQPALPVDTNVCRVVSRISGLEFKSDYVRTTFEKIFKRENWMEVHELLRLHGQAICKKSKACDKCNVGSCASRKSAFHNSDAAKAAGKAVIDEWEKWRRLLLKPGC